MKQRGSERAREASTAATQVQPIIAQERWSDMPPRVGIVPAPDGAVYRETPTEVQQPVRAPESQPAMETVEESLDAAWAAVEQLWDDGGRAGPVLALSAEPEAETPEPSPLYAETAAAVSVTEPDADLLTAGVLDEQAPLDWGALHDVEETPDAGEDVPQDETRVTERRPDDDPPAGGGLPLAVEPAQLAVAPRYAWVGAASGWPPWRGVLPDGMGRQALVSLTQGLREMRRRGPIEVRRASDATEQLMARVRADLTERRAEWGREPASHRRRGYRGDHRMAVA